MNQQETSSKSSCINQEDSFQPN